MAILAVKIDNLATLRMNEFFDYAGHCWALSRSRDGEDAVGAELEDFYEGTQFRHPIHEEFTDNLHKLLRVQDQIFIRPQRIHPRGCTTDNLPRVD